MNFYNEALTEALFSGRYICSQCGKLMEFEDEWRETLVCPACGHSIDLEHYGLDEEEYDSLYPTIDELDDD